MTDTVSVDAAPELFGPYRIDELLGRGGMGEVHRAFDTVHERYVALKRLPLLAGREFENRFRREARIAEQLRAPHVVPVHAHGEIDGRLYIDMRLIDGPDLKRLLADGPVPPERIVEILSQVAVALDAAHARSVLHRDVKPANVLLDADGTAYLADFGIARLFTPDVTRLTETGDAVGTLDYMAPERLTEGEAGPASDVYSLACVLFQCLTGRVPFPAADSVGKLTAQLNDPPPAASLFDRWIPPAIDLVIQTGMDKDPRRRYPSAGELMAAAAAILTEAPASAPPDPPSTDDHGQAYFVRLLAAVGAGHGDSQRTAPSAQARQDVGTDSTDVIRDQCPYPGLQSFGAADTQWFFGREQAVRDLLARLSRQRDSGPLVVVGASGAGKSSLLHAGLLAAHAGAGGMAPQLAMTPGERPIATLAARMATFVRADPNRLAWQLYEQPASFRAMCQAAVARADAPMLIVVDQAEELFTQCADPREREAFATALANAWPARVVLAMRADFVEHFIRLPSLKPSLAAPFVLGPMTAKELARVIVGPAEAAGLELEPGLVDRLITDVGAGDDLGALPRLAHALRETWRNRTGNRLTLAGYQQTGGVDRAVALTADTMYARLNEYDRHALRAAVLRMITLLDGGGIARRWAHRAEVPNRVVESLVAVRLVTIDRDYVQLSHDALLTAWPRLRGWVEEDRQGLLVRQQLGVAVAGWRTSGRDRSDVYRGARLAAAQEWAAGRTDLTPDERAFLRASDRERRRRTRQLQGVVAGLAILLVGALVAGVLAMVARAEAEQGRQDAESRQLAAESRAEAEVNPVSAMRKAVESWRAGPTMEARGALLSAPLITYPSAFSTGLSNVSSVDVSPDGGLVAVGSGEGRIVLWDTKARKPVDTGITAKGFVSVVRFSPDGTLLATSDADRDGDVGASSVRIWDVATGRQVAQLANNLPAIGQLAWRPDGQAVAALSLQQDDTRGVGEWDPRSGKLIRTIAKGVVDASSIAYSTTGDRLAIGRGDGSAELWDTAAATRVSRRTEHADATTRRGPGGLMPVQVTFSGRLLATSSVLDNMIRLWDPRTGEPVLAFPDVTRQADSAGAAGPSSLMFTPDGRTLYTNSDLNSITAWDPGNGTFLGNLPQGLRKGTTVGLTVVAITVTRDGRTWVAANSDGTVQRWHTNTNWYNDPGASVMSLAFRPGGNEIAAGDADSGLYTWDTVSGAEITRTTEQSGGVLAIAYTPDGTRITGAGNATFTVTPPERGATSRKVALPGRLFIGRGAMAVSPDGRWIAATHQPADPALAAQDFRITVWDTATLTERAVLEMGREWPLDLTFSPDGDKLLALTSSSGTGVAGSDPDGSDTAAGMVTWRTPGFTGESRTPLGGNTLNTVVYTPDGRSLITAGISGLLQIRDAATGQVRKQFGQHPSMVRRIAISPDGRTLASVTAEDSTIRLWNLADPEPGLAANLNAHLSSLNDIVFSPDGTRLASGGTDTNVAVWRLDPADVTRQVCTSLLDAAPDDLGTTGCR
ncbi:serine/threonine-protein kinase [Kibdelosporangium persicum]|uniref:Serine/threonine protein kinase n=1 Tax=Kibdelosporangium persicum TaxID=2698649 RepID=A0ABX2F1L3_9PSEU|nr:serine/threonine-protein kinase [Kibdelosporangium persicum]NRN65213.1 Serine/threonine protein kinase [Kibdelosporangium persicum]